MDARQFIVTQIREACRGLKVDYLYGSPTWSDATFFRACALRLARGDDAAWQEFIERLRADRKTTSTVRSILIDREVLRESTSSSRATTLHLPADVAPFSRSEAKQFLAVLDIQERDQMILADPMAFLAPDVAGVYQITDCKAFIPPSKPSRSEIMYIEMKPGLTGPGRIGRVQFSQTGKTIYYDGKKSSSR